MRKLIYYGDYVGLWSDGELVINDGVGLVGTEDALELYNALKKYFESK